VSHAGPWANPGAIAKILKWMGREDGPLLFRPRADLQQWLWGLRFLAECLPGRNHSNATQLLRLGLYSRAMLRELRATTGIEYDHLERGILPYTSQAELEASRAAKSCVGLGRISNQDAGRVRRDRTCACVYADRSPAAAIPRRTRPAMRISCPGARALCSDRGVNSTRERRSSASSPKAIR
jgi:hypothetical protein